jgi:hypothetical protein
MDAKRKGAGENPMGVGTRIHHIHAQALGILRWRKQTPSFQFRSCKRRYTALSVVGMDSCRDARGGGGGWWFPIFSAG